MVLALALVLVLAQVTSAIQKAGPVTRTYGRPKAHNHSQRQDLNRLVSVGIDLSLY